MIPYGHQDLSDDDIDAVVEALRSEWLTQGPAVERFESAVAEYCGVSQAVAVANGTAALHIAALALNLGPGKRLWTSPNTFVASANCARYCGADVGFVDIDPKTLCMSAEALEHRLEMAECTGTLPDVLVPVHFGGQSCDMLAISALARKYGFSVVEDCSHAIGGRYQGEPVGNCRYGDLSTFSFHPVKVVTSGEGGMVVTNNEAAAARLRLFRTHGVTRERDQVGCANEGAWYYEQVALGYNYRLTDIQAALGASQMKRLDDFVARRNELARRYREQLASLPVRFQVQPSDVVSAFHLFVIQLSEDATKTRKQAFEELRQAGIGVNVHYIPVHMQPYYRALGFNEGDFPNAEDYYRRALTLPLYSSMSDRQHGEVVAAVTKVLG